MKGFVYILTNTRNSVLYSGVTSDIYNRLKQHKIRKNQKGFSARYNLDKLVYFEKFDNIGDAIKREKQISLISGMNPDRNDLREVLEG